MGRGCHQGSSELTACGGGGLILRREGTLREGEEGWAAPAPRGERTAAAGGRGERPGSEHFGGELGGLPPRTEETQARGCILRRVPGTLIGEVVAQAGTHLA